EAGGAGGLQQLRNGDFLVAQKVILDELRNRKIEPVLAGDEDKASEPGGFRPSFGGKCSSNFGFGTGELIHPKSCWLPDYGASALLWAIYPCIAAMQQYRGLIMSSWTCFFNPGFDGQQGFWL